MPRDLMAVAEAIDNAECTNNGLEGLIALLFSANQADVPSGQAIGDLLRVLQQDMGRHLSSAKAGLRTTRSD